MTSACNIPTTISMPGIGSVWVNKRTKKEAIVIDVGLEGNSALVDMIVYEYPTEPNHPSMRFRKLLDHWYEAFEQPLTIS